MSTSPAANPTDAPGGRSAAPPRVAMAVVIINYKTAAMTADCLASLEPEVATLPGGCRVVVVDNLSPDDSADRIEETIAARGWGSWAEVVRSPVNGGFSAGNNVGIKAVDAESYLLLNSDTLVRPGALRTLHDTLRERPEVGLVGPRLEWPDGTPQISCFRNINPLSELAEAARTRPVSALLRRFEVAIPVSDAPIEPDWTSFACVLVRREVVERVGLMDEGYFMYFEDCDYCRAARKAGWVVAHQPAARVVHLRGGSSPVKSLAAARKRRPRYYYAARARYFAKHYGIAGLWLTNGLWLLGRSVSLLREIVGHKEPHTCEQEHRDIWINAWRP